MLEHYTDGEFEIVNVPGKMMGGPETLEFRDTIYSLFNKKKRKIIINLSNVDWINSAGVGALMAGYITFTRQNFDIKFACLSEKVREVLDMTRIDRIIEVYDSLEEAKGR